MRALRGKAEATEHCLRVRSPMRCPKTRQGWNEVNTAIILDRGCKIGRFSCRRQYPQLVPQPFDETASDKDRSFQRVMALPFDLRSEEHTSELQSLMRISYAVFCLKKKNNHNHSKTHHDQYVTSHILH